MEIVCVYNDKGGVGKTAIALEMASALATAKKKVLLVDNDPQGSLSALVAKDLDGIGEGLDAVYSGGKNIIECIRETYIDDMFLVPSGGNLKKHYSDIDKTDKIISASAAFMKTNNDFIDAIDVVIIDNPPAQDGPPMLWINEAQRIVIPVVPDEVCYDALIRTYQFLENQAAGFSEKFVVIVPSLVMNRGLHKKYLEAIYNEFLGKNGNTVVSEVKIANRAEIPESISLRQTLFISHAASESAMQMRKLCLTVFPWIDAGAFSEAIESAALKKKQAIRDKFKKMVLRNKFPIAKKHPAMERKVAVHA